MGFGVCPLLAPGSTVSPPRGTGSRSNRFVGLGGDTSRPRASGGLGRAGTDAKKQTRAACVLPGREPSGRAGMACWSPGTGPRGAGGWTTAGAAAPRAGGKLRHESMEGPIQVIEQEALAVTAETSQCPHTGSSPSASQAEPWWLPLASPACLGAAVGCAPAPGWPDPGPRHPPPWGAARVLSAIPAGRNASGGIPGNWFYPSIRCWRQDGGSGRRSSLGKGI